MCLGRALSILEHMFLLSKLLEIHNIYIQTEPMYALSSPLQISNNRLIMDGKPV